MIPCHVLTSYLHQFYCLPCSHYLSLYTMIQTLFFCLHNTTKSSAIQLAFSSCWEFSAIHCNTTWEKDEEYSHATCNVSFLPTNYQEGRMDKQCQETSYYVYSSARRRVPSSIGTCRSACSHCKPIAYKCGQCLQRSSHTSAVLNLPATLQPPMQPHLTFTYPLSPSNAFHPAHSGTYCWFPSQALCHVLPWHSVILSAVDLWLPAHSMYVPQALTFQQPGSCLYMSGTLSWDLHSQ